MNNLVANLNNSNAGVDNISNSMPIGISSVRCNLFQVNLCV